MQGNFVLHLLSNKNNACIAVFPYLLCRQDKKEFTSSFDELSPSAIPCNEVHPPGADTFEVFLSISFSPRELFREDHPDPFLQYLSNKSLFNLHILEM